VNYLVNNEDQSMTLAGDIPMNSRVQLMMASVDDIADGLRGEFAMK
jgi:hypothetical protein